MFCCALQLDEGCTQELDALRTGAGGGACAEGGREKERERWVALPPQVRGEVLVGAELWAPPIDDEPFWASWMLGRSMTVVWCILILDSELCCYVVMQRAAGQPSPIAA